MTVPPDGIDRLVKYDPETGLLTWLPRPREMFQEEWMWRSWNTNYARKECGSLSGTGYVQVGILGWNCTAHRIAWFLMTGEWPSLHIDHINGVKTDNRFVNLRVVDHAANAQNRRLPNKNNRVGFLGVCPEGKERFGAKIRVNGVRIWLGAFDTPELAHAAYLKAKAALHKGATHGKQ